MAASEQSTRTRQGPVLACLRPSPGGSRQRELSTRCVPTPTAAFRKGNSVPRTYGLRKPDHLSYLIRCSSTTCEAAGTIARNSLEERIEVREKLPTTLRELQCSFVNDEQFKFTLPPTLPQFGLRPAHTAIQYRRGTTRTGALDGRGMRGCFDSNIDHAIHEGKKTPHHLNH